MKNITLDVTYKNVSLDVTYKNVSLDVMYKKSMVSIWPFRDADIGYKENKSCFTNQLHTVHFVS